LLYIKTCGLKCKRDLKGFLLKNKNRHTRLQVKERRKREKKGFEKLRSLKGKRKVLVFKKKINLEPILTAVVKSKT
jgi:hypothetical protein